MAGKGWTEFVIGRGILEGWGPPLFWGALCFLLLSAPQIWPAWERGGNAKAATVEGLSELSAIQFPLFHSPVFIRNGDSPVRLILDGEDTWGCLALGTGLQSSLSVGILRSV